MMSLKQAVTVKPLAGHGGTAARLPAAIARASPGRIDGESEKGQPARQKTRGKKRLHRLYRRMLASCSGRWPANPEHFADRSYFNRVTRNQLHDSICFLYRNSWHNIHSLKGERQNES